MRLADLSKRIGAIEDALAATGDCHVCHGMGALGPYAVQELEHRDLPAACPSCGRVAKRQHFVAGVSQCELDAMFRPSPVTHATLFIWENV